MKRKRLLAITMAIFVTLVSTACTGRAQDAPAVPDDVVTEEAAGDEHAQAEQSTTQAEEVTGRYEGVFVEAYGDRSKMEELYSNGENYIELNTDGKGTISLDGETNAVTWMLDDNKLTLSMTIEDEKVDNEGAIENGVLSFNLDGLGIYMIFAKEGVDTSTIPMLTEVPDDDGALEELYEEEAENDEFYEGTTDPEEDEPMEDVDPEELSSPEEVIEFGDYDSMSAFSTDTQNAKNVGSVVKIDGLVSHFDDGMSYSIVQSNAQGTGRVGTVFIIQGAEENSYPTDGTRVVLTGKVCYNPNIYGYCICTLPDFIQVVR